MQTRTLLTTPPGQTPVDENHTIRGEAYSRGLALPSEPRVPRRGGKLAGVIVTVGVLGMFAWIAFRIIADTQTFDPALDSNVPGVQAPADAGLPGEDVGG